MKVVIDVKSSIKTHTNLCYNFHTFMLEPQLLPVIHYNLESQGREKKFILNQQKCAASGNNDWTDVNT